MAARCRCPTARPSGPTASACASTVSARPGWSMPATPVARRADPIIHGMPHAAAPQADAWRAALRGSRSADVELRAVRQPRLGFGHRRGPAGLVRPSVRRARIGVHSTPVICSRHDPVGQVPTLLLPDGQVMTESAAMTLHLADLSGRDDLVPGPAAAERAAFLRWLVFLVANIYRLHLCRRPVALRQGRGRACRLSCCVRRPRAASVAGGGGAGRLAVVSGPAAVRTGHLLRRDDTLATAPQLVRRTCSACPGRR